MKCRVLNSLINLNIRRSLVLSGMEIVRFWETIKLALRARRVKAELDPEGRGKDLVGKGLGTVRARLACFLIKKKPPSIL